MVHLEIRRIKIIFHINRPHLTFDILSILKKYDVYIVSMEVYSNVIYLKLPYISDNTLQKIEEEWKDVYGFDHMENVDVMAFEEKDIELRGVLNLMREGVVILSVKGIVEYFNNKVPVALRDIKVGSSIFDFIENENLKNFIEMSGEVSNFGTMRNVEIELDSKNYLLNVDSLYSEDRIFSGFLLTLKEITLDYSFDNYITFEDLVGEDEKFKESIEKAKNASKVESPVLLVGGSGTGKEMFARAIHSNSDRSTKAFVGINCAAMPEELLESELFGYESGSFIGANGNGKRGILEIADGGTVFLDEIGEMNYHIQSRLLKIIEEMEAVPRNSSEEVPLDIRIIAATSKDLEKLIEEKKFRVDLFYKLNILKIEIPTIRERPKDIEVLIEYFLKVLSKRYGDKKIEISQGAIDKMKSYCWPGNIREMQNVLEKALVLSDGGVIESENITFDTSEVYNREMTEGADLNSAVSYFERNFILKALRNNSSIRAAAKELNVTHTLLLNRIKKYEIRDEDWKK
ncbi:sigma 54-interacting transcriptional regulator [Anaerosphaera aminiphila]|uniref:sigma 54-interacting transcriptional regulator n=1 Tax=Anaerosphaera aminiphila TaxID=1120994 RepID=UPI00190EEBB0|nr:sigma 54-interacting transcriptional regulator [Anaerosphaera aminiphila]